MRHTQGPQVRPLAPTRPALAPRGDARAGEGALLEPPHCCLSQLKRVIPEAGLFPTAAGATAQPRPTEQAPEKMLVQALRVDRPAEIHPACPSATRAGCLCSRPGLTPRDLQRVQGQPLG